jgi:hypothetical protein
MNSTNGTFFESHRLPGKTAFLLNDGDCIHLRHAADIQLLQSNVLKQDVQRVIGENIDLNRLEKTFHIHDRLIGYGGQAKVYSFIYILTSDFPCSES